MVVWVPHVPVVVHLCQVDGLARHVKVVKILERGKEVTLGLAHFILNLPRDQ